MNKQILYAVHSFLITSKLIIVLGIVSLYLFTVKFHNREIHIIELALLVSGTLFIYLLHQFKTRKKWSILGFCLLLVSMIAVWIRRQEFSLQYLLPLLFPGFIAINYLGFYRQNKSIRDHPILKPLALGFTWSMVAHLAFFISFSVDTLFTFVIIFLMITAQAFVFDIKDISFDTQQQRSTLAILKGVVFCKKWAVFILLFSSLLTIAGFGLQIVSVSFLIILLFTFAVQIITILNIHPKMSSSYYYIVLDGTLLLPGIFALLV